MTKSLSTTPSTTHTTTISGLVKGTSYTLYARCKDVAGNVNAADTAVTFSVSAGTTKPVY